MADLNVSRKNVRQLLSLDEPATKGKRFVIPEYQRPYRWDTEKCDILWTDLYNFFTENQDENGKFNSAHEYFLGTIVTCTDKASSNSIEVIDGQQRLTTLFLLLRAFYAQFELLHKDSPADAQLTGLMSKISPCIWNVDDMSGEVKDKADIHISSLVITDEDNKLFHDILAKGIASEKSKSRYAENYRFFQDKISEGSASYYLKEFCLCILNCCIVLPIECQDLDAALSIFGTLNDRGLPLSDSDIFKSVLFRRLQTKQEKDQFTSDWKDLEKTVKDGGFTIDDVFRYYSHIIRGKNNNDKPEIGLRRFYSGDKNKYELLTKEFFESLEDLAAFWYDVNVPPKPEDESRESFCTERARKFMHCLKCYPNDFWRYPVSVFYHEYGKEPDFKEQLESFLVSLTANLFARFIVSPTVNKIKNPVYAACIAIARHEQVDFQYQLPSDMNTRISAFGYSRMTKALILLNAYLFDEDQPLIDESFQIEHIFPLKWQNTNYNGWNKDEANEYLNNIGNKTPLEWRLNIQAGNGYFGQKKGKYVRSAIREVQHIAGLPQNDWVKQDIIDREEELVNRLVLFFVKYLSKEEQIVEFAFPNGSVSIYSGAGNNQFRLVTINPDAKEQLFSTFEEALSSVDSGIIKYAHMTAKNDDVKNEVESFKNGL